MPSLQTPELRGGFREGSAAMLELGENGLTRGRKHFSHCRQWACSHKWENSTTVSVKNQKPTCCYKDHSLLSCKGQNFHSYPFCPGHSCGNLASAQSQAEGAQIQNFYRSDTGKDSASKGKRQYGFSVKTGRITVSTFPNQWVILLQKSLNSPVSFMRFLKH